MGPRSILGCVLSLFVMVCARPAVNPPSSPDSFSFLYTVVAHYEPLSWIQGGERFSSDVAIYIRGTSGSRKLVPDFAASADPAISFDGQRVLFAGKSKAQDPWQIWEVPLNGGDPRRITSGSQDCIRPFYLPEDRVVYARKVAGRFRIEAVELSDGKPLPLTYGPDNFLPTDVLRDGRILFDSGYPLGSGTTPEIYTVYSDGSGVESYRCDHGKARAQGMQMGSGDIVFASNVASHLSLARFTSARAQEVPISAPAGDYGGDVTQTSSGDWFLPWRADANARFQLMLWTPGTPTLRLVLAEKNANVIQPTPIGARPAPNRHPSGLHDWPNANLLCLNAYTSRYHFSPGSIRSVRVYSRDEAGHPKLLGTAPVERDGSFFVHLPTEQPLQIELLNAGNKTLKRESGFFWMRRGEQRICVGCHAGPETAPENAVPMILLRSTTPVDMAGGTASGASGGH